MKKLQQISVIGTGLLGASVTLAILRAIPSVKTVAFSHRPSTRQKAARLQIAHNIVNDIHKCVEDADIVILATPIQTFAATFKEIANSLKDGCIVTDVGSTKVLPHRWAAKCLGKNVHYVGSHPIAGSEKRGVEFARDDLFSSAQCILTKTPRTNPEALRTMRKFWSAIGCSVTIMTPARHDRIMAQVSHLPHVAAAALVNATDKETINFAGKGFIDTSRIASGPDNIWSDILVTNSPNIVRGVDRLIKELTVLKNAVKDGDDNKVAKLLTKARAKRTALIKHKIKKKELL